MPHPSLLLLVRPGRVLIQPEAYNPKPDVDFTPLLEQARVTR